MTTMLNTLARHYTNLTPKGRAILCVLVAAYARGDDGLTRRDIAYGLGQGRLYPHDDRALQQLAALGFIDIVPHRRREYLALQWQDASILNAPGIEMHTRFHLHHLNGSLYADLSKIIRQEDQGVSAESMSFSAVDRAESPVQRLRRWLG